jgi:hypothetical protein
MQTLGKELCNLIEDRDDLTYSLVAKYIEASKQCMSKFKTEGVIGFRKLLRLSYLLFPANQKEVMSEWCLRVNTTEAIRQSFEYAAITRNIELLNKLITKYNKEKGTLGEYVCIYLIIYKYMINEISGFDLIANVKKLGSIKDESLNILIEIIKCYNYYFDNKFTLMVETAREAERSLEFLSNKRELFIKECFLHRIAEVLGPAYLHLNKLNLARHYAFTIINADICPKTISDASYIVGMSYLLEDERKCVEYLQRSYDIAKTIGDSNIENEARLNLDFAKLYLNIELSEDSNTSLINFQKNRDSEISLNLLKEVMYQKGEEDLIVLFEIIQSKSLMKMYGCFNTFLSQTNLFFASLIAKEMQKAGDTSMLVENMIKFTLNLEERVYFEKDFISGFNSFSDRRSSGICA